MTDDLSVWLVLAAIPVHRLGLSLRSVLRRPVSAAGTGPAPAESSAPGPGHSVSALGPAVASGSPGGRGASLHTVSGGGRVAAVSGWRRGLSLPEMEKSG